MQQIPHTVDTIVEGRPYGGAAGQLHGAGLRASGTFGGASSSARAGGGGSEVGLQLLLANAQEFTFRPRINDSSRAMVRNTYPVDRCVGCRQHAEGVCLPLLGHLLSGAGAH